jgi:hypothetical protein
VAASHHCLLHAASHRNWLQAASHRKRPPSRVDSLHLAWSPPSRHIRPSSSDTNCWRCISQRLFFFLNSLSL